MNLPEHYDHFQTFGVPIVWDDMGATWEKAFSVVVPEVWNTLSWEIYLSPSVVLFLQRVKTPPPHTLVFPH